MQLSDEMVERAVAAAERGWGDGLAFASCVREGLRAAVDSIPDPASVSVPHGGIEGSPEFRELKRAWDAASAERDQLRAELEKTRAELEAERADSHDVDAMRDELDARLRESGAVSRKHLQREYDAWNAEYTRLLEQHEALRAKFDDRCAELVWAYDARRKSAARIRQLVEYYRKLGNIVRTGTDVANALHGEALELERALLKPAPAWQHTSSDGDSHTFRHANGETRTLEGFATSAEAARHLDEPAQYHPNDLDDVDGDVSQLDEPGRTVPAEAEPETCLDPGCDDCHSGTQGCSLNRAPVQHPQPQSAMVEQAGPSALQLRMERLERELREVAEVQRAFLAAWAHGSFNKARAAEVLEALDARKGAP
jgi:Skp family chaperone for outer membrane proteins